MPQPQTHRSPEETGRLARAVYDRQVGPLVKPEDDGKFVAVDVLSGAFEVSDSDYDAVMGLRKRLPGAEIFLMRVGRDSTYSFGGAE